MNNLLSNSYNYLKPMGKVDVVLMEQNSNIIIKVIDNGIGIPKKEFQKRTCLIYLNVFIEVIYPAIKIPVVQV